MIQRCRRRSGRIIDHLAPRVERRMP
jgi:hypothetical protein